MGDLKKGRGDRKIYIPMQNMNEGRRYGGKVDFAKGIHTFKPFFTWNEMEKGLRFFIIFFLIEVRGEIMVVFTR